MSSTSRLRWVVKYTACGPSPTCDDRNIESPDEWGVLKTTAIQWTGWEEEQHKTLPKEFWGAKHLEIHEGDVLVTKAGPRQRVGVSAYVDKTQPRLIVSGKMILLRVNQSAIDPRYLNWQLATPEPQAYLNACKSGMAEAQMNFANEDLLAMVINLPPIGEQRRIADFLDAETGRVDELSALQARVLSGLRLRDQAVRDNLVERLFAEVGGVPIRRRIRTVEQGSSPACFSYPRESNDWGVVKAQRSKGWGRASARGSSQSMIKIRGDDIRDWPIPRATSRQQQTLVSAIGKELSSSAEARAVISRQLSVLAERRQALITAAVTGQIDVTTARGVDV